MYYSTRMRIIKVDVTHVDDVENKTSCFTKYLNPRKGLIGMNGFYPLHSGQGLQETIEVM